MSYAICMVHFIIQGIGDGAQPLLSRYYGAGEQEALAQVRTLTFRSAPAAALLCGIALFLGRSAHPPPVWGIQCRYPAVPGDPAPVPALSPVHVGSAHPDLLLLRHRADHPGRPADLRASPVVLVALSLILPRTGLGLSGVWLSVPLTQILLAGAGVLLLHTAHAGTKPIPAAAPQQAVPSVSLSV